MAYADFSEALPKPHGNALPSANGSAHYGPQGIVTPKTRTLPGAQKIRQDF